MAAPLAHFPNRFAAAVDVVKAGDADRVVTFGDATANGMRRRSYQEACPSSFTSCYDQVQRDMLSMMLFA